MKKFFPAALALLVPIFILACPASKSAQASLFQKLPKQTLTQPSTDGNVYSPVSGVIASLPGKIRREVRSGLHVAIKTEESYFFGIKEKKAEFTVITGNLSTIKRKSGKIEKGDLLGTANDGQAFTLVMADAPEPFLVCSAAHKAEPLLGKWWFDGAFLFDSIADRWLGYEPSPSAPAALRAMLSGGTNNRFRLNLPSTFFPEKIPAGLVEELSAYDESRTGVEEVDSMTTFTEEGMQYSVFWPVPFDRYLRDEYERGKPLWVFCTVVPCDIDTRKVYIFARDFLLEPIETLYETRAAELVMEDFYVDR